VSDAEEGFALALRALKHPTPVREFRFHHTRKFRFDFAWPEHKVAMEVEGGVGGRAKSRHSTFTGFEKDCFKYALAAQEGWRLYRFSTTQVMKGVAMTFMEKEFKKWENEK